MGTDTLIDVLSAIYEKPRSLQSNYVRSYAQDVARLASLGLITTAVKGGYGSLWRCTYKGLRVLDYRDTE